VVAAIEAIDHSLKALGKRDRDGVKAKLEEQRDALAASLLAFAALGGDSAGTTKPQCSGERFAAVLAGVESAYLECCCRASVSVEK
jgi:hypothetical protein